MSREEIKSKIPHGYGKVIAESIGVTPKTIYLYLNGKSNSHKVEIAVLKALAEIKAEKTRLIKSC